MKRVAWLGALVGAAGLLGFFGACERHPYSETSALFKPHGAGSAGHGASDAHAPGQAGTAPAGHAAETKSFFEGESH